MLVPPGVVTVTSTAPVEPTGDVAVICVAELTVKPVAFVEPNFTDEADKRFVPVITTDIPPAAAPLEGEMLVIVGAFGKVV